MLLPPSGRRHLHQPKQQSGNSSTTAYYHHYNEYEERHFWKARYLQMQNKCEQAQYSIREMEEDKRQLEYRIDELEEQLLMQLSSRREQQQRFFKLI